MHGSKIGIPSFPSLQKSSKSEEYRTRWERNPTKKPPRFFCGKSFGYISKGYKGISRLYQTARRKRACIYFVVSCTNVFAMCFFGFVDFVFLKLRGLPYVILGGQSLFWFLNFFFAVNSCQMRWRSSIRLLRTILVLAHL